MNNFQPPVYSVIIWPEDIRESSYSRFWNQSLEAMFRVAFRRFPNGYYIAYVEETQDVAFGMTEKESLDHLIPLMIQRFSDTEFAERFSIPKKFSSFQVTDSVYTNNPLYTKRIYLKMQFSNPYIEKNVYNPPPNTPCVRILISDQDLPKMGRLIGHHGQHFIQWTQKYGLDYIWFHKEKKEIEIYGRCIPNPVVNELIGTLRAL